MDIFLYCTYNYFLLINIKLVPVVIETRLHMQTKKFIINYLNGVKVYLDVLFFCLVEVFPDFLQGPKINLVVKKIKIKKIKYILDITAFCTYIKSVSNFSSLAATISKIFFYFSFNN